MKIKGLKNHSRLTIEGTPTDYFFFLIATTTTTTTRPLAFSIDKLPLQYLKKP